MNYEFNKLYFSLVKYCTKNGKKYDVHALYKDNETEELIDLDLSKPILPYGYEEKYFKKALISFSDVLYRTRISWGFLNLNDVLKIKEIYLRYYFDFLRNKGINDISDLNNVEAYTKKKK